MPNSKPVRFYGKIDNVDQILFTAREATGGGLTLTCRYPSKYELEGEMIEYKSQHYSIHLSNNGEDTTITQKTELIDGKNISTAQFIKGTRDFLLASVFCKRDCEWVDSDRTLIPNNKEEHLQIASYNSKLHTLYYGVFVSKLNWKPPHLAKGFATQFVYKFQELQIIVLVSYTSGPTYRQGDTVVYTTSSPKINDKSIAKFDRITGSNLSVKQASELLKSLFYGLRDRLVDRIEKNEKDILSDAFSNIVLHSSLENFYPIAPRKKVITKTIKKHIKSHIPKK